MIDSARFWGPHQLPEFLAVVSSCPDAASASLAAVEWAAELLDAEVCAVFEGSRLIAQVGYPPDSVPQRELQAVLTSGRGSIEVPGWGRCHVVTATLQDSTPGHLLVGRAGAFFSAEEVSLIRAMARILSLSLRQIAIITSERNLRVEHEHHIEENERLVLALRERQELLEQLSYVQRAIAMRAPLQEVLDAITSSTSRLFGNELVALYVQDSDDPGYLLRVSSCGIKGEIADRLWRVPADYGVAGAVFQEGRFVHFPDYQSVDGLAPEWKEYGLQTAMGTPVRENGRIAGSLSVASRDPERSYSLSERQMLQSFADHVCLALTDAHATEAVRQALHDPLTGLPNRSLLMDRLSHALSRAREHEHRVAVLFIDLDGFKVINDRSGHAVGDQVLVEVSRRLQSAVRACDTPARYGGDEFVVLLTSDDPDIADATGVAGRILGALRPPISIDGEELSVDASIGISISRQGDEHAEDLIDQADRAMYSAKAHGRGRWEVHRPGMERTSAAATADGDDERPGSGAGEAGLEPATTLPVGEPAPEPVRPGPEPREPAGRGGDGRSPGGDH